MVGYSRLMEADEEGTLGTLKAYREVIDQLAAKHGGRVFGGAGDSLVAEFGSAVEAVRCAMSMQKDLGVRNAELAEERRMIFRIGINVGDVMVEGDNLFGDGVNVAARLEGLSRPGEVCVSRTVFDHVKAKVDRAASSCREEEGTLARLEPEYAATSSVENMGDKWRERNGRECLGELCPRKKQS